MRLVTMNIWGTRGAWDERRRVLRRGFEELAPDLFSLQETIVTEGYDQVRDLLGETYHVVHQRDREDDGQGISIASRWPLRDVRELDLDVSDRTADFACTALLAEVEAPFGSVLLVNHFPSWKLQLEAEREEQAVIVAREIERSVDADTHVVIAGDLDADPNAASIDFLLGRRSLAGMSVCYRDAWDSAHPDAQGHTYTPENGLMDDDWPFRRIDYVLVRCGEHGGPTLTIARCDRIFDRPVDGVWASDHYGLVADLATPAAR